MSDNWAINSFPVEWEFNTEYMNYTGYCKVREVHYRILWDDLYRYALCSNDYWSFRSNCIDGKIFAINKYGNVSLPINNSAIETITNHAWHQYKALTGA